MVVIKLTKEILDILPNIKVQKDFSRAIIDGKDLFYTSNALEIILMSWGKYDEHIKDSEKSMDGRRWDSELENKAWDTYEYIVEHLNEIISICLVLGAFGIEPGIYSRKEKEEGIWSYTEFPN